MNDEEQLPPLGTCAPYIDDSLSLTISSGETTSLEAILARGPTTWTQVYTTDNSVYINRDSKGSAALFQGQSRFGVRALAKDRKRHQGSTWKPSRRAQGQDLPARLGHPCRSRPSRDSAESIVAVGVRHSLCYHFSPSLGMFQSLYALLSYLTSHISPITLARAGRRARWWHD